jgi:protein O-mannosyl-transferase
MHTMNTLSDKMNSFFKMKRFNLIAFALIAGLILIAYSNTFTASFHFDDNPSIVENAAIKRVTVDNIISMFQGTRPVVNLSLMFNYAVSGLNVVGWHIFNIGCHIANSIFVYLLLLWTLDLPALNGKYGDRAKRMALFGALLFGVHPIQTESVTYIISRTELIAAFFYLATFLFFIKGATTGKFKFYVGSFFTSLLAMGSKEWAVTLPAMILLYDFLFLSDSKIKPVLARWKAYVLVALPWGFIAYTLSTTKLSGAGFGITGQNNITPWTYLLTSFNVLWTYLRLLILPINQNLDYEYPLARTLLEFPTLLSFAGHIAVVVAAFWLYKKKGWTLIPYGVAWFYITLSPTQSFVPILDVIFEHRVYLPSIGFFIAFIAAFEGVFDWFEQRKTVKADRAAA